MSESRVSAGPDRAAFIELCAGLGLGDAGYLDYHASRFIAVRDRLLRQWVPARDGGRLLDVGAHWLHNAVLFAASGFQVTAGELTGQGPLEHAPSREAAGKAGIRLLEYHDLADPVEIAALGEDSFDVINFSEILEHITFNPVRMWTALHRVLRKGGRILLTTPNYYSCESPFGLVEDVTRLLQGQGSGLGVRHLVGMHTTGPHWKEFSASDIREYFALLSRDFRVRTVEALDLYAPEPLRLHQVLNKMRGHWLSVVSDRPRLVDELVNFFAEKHGDALVMPTLYVEVELVSKSRGITAVPHW